MDQLEPMRNDMMEGAEGEDPFAGVPSEDPAPEGDNADPFGGEDAEPEDTNAAEVFGGVDEGEEDVFSGAIDEKDAGEMKDIVPPADGPYVKWQEEHAEMLQKRMQEAREKKEKNLEEAEENMKKFYSERESSLGKMHSENVSDEKQKREDIAKLFKDGENDWEKVCKMLSLQPDSNRKVDRFRKLLTKLKNEGTYSKSKREAKA